MLSELIDHGSDSDMIQDILGLDLNDESQIRRQLRKKAYLRYRRLCAVTDQRKALTVILKSIAQNKSLADQLFKATIYPLFLFGISLMMLMFVDRILLETFQTMLAFLGPLSETANYKIGLEILIGMDFMLLVMGLILMGWIRYEPIRLYTELSRRKPKNLWTGLISHEFCMKFFQFYRLGSSIDQIFILIQESSGPVLAQRCAMALQKLQGGAELYEAVFVIDPRLKSIFRLGDEGIDIEAYLDHHNQMQDRLLTRQIKKAGKALLALDYIQIALIIILIYQMMLKPIEMMGNYL